MKKSKSKEPRDRLSELPDSVIFNIFGLLPMGDVVRTTILSNRWKNLWTTNPCLYFDDDCVIYDSLDAVRNFVNRALLCWRGIRIQKFKIRFSSLSDKSLFGDIDLWLRFATDNQVEDLHLDLELLINAFEQGDDEDYLVPQCLYSCSSLKELLFRGCNFEIKGNVQWNQLKRLKIDGNVVTEHVINQVLCGSPHLEVFILCLEETLENLSICFRSTSLKELSIRKSSNCINDQSISRELRIWTPNLETLEILGLPYSKCLLMNVLSLTHATLGFSVHYHGFYWNNLLEETLMQILPNIQHVGRVTLLNCCVKVLGEMKKKDLVSPLSNVEFLKLNGRFVEYEQIVGVLEIFPKLKMLDFHDEMNMKLYNYKDVEELLKFDAKSYPESFLLQLRTVNVTWAKDDYSIFPFIEMVLKYASKLEKMVFRVKGMMPPAQPSNSLLLASQKLLRMPRSSPTALFIFCE